MSSFKQPSHFTPVVTSVEDIKLLLSQYNNLDDLGNLFNLINRDLSQPLHTQVTDVEYTELLLDTGYATEEEYNRLFKVKTLVHMYDKMSNNKEDAEYAQLVEVKKTFITKCCQSNLVNLEVNDSQLTNIYNLFYLHILPLDQITIELVKIFPTIELSKIKVLYKLLSQDTQKISYEEFETFISSIIKFFTESTIQTIELNFNKPIELLSDDIKHLLQAYVNVKEITKENIKFLFDKFDENHDGFVSYNEFLHQYLGHISLKISPDFLLNK